MVWNPRRARDRRRLRDRRSSGARRPAQPAAAANDSAAPGRSGRPDHSARPGRPSARALAGAARLALAAGVIGRRPPVPAARARVGGRPHSRARDKAVIAHHYDLSNDFYELLLDPAMCYSCGCWTSQDPATGGRRPTGQARHGVPQARPGTGDAPARRRLRLGSLVHYAAARYGVKVTGVTLSAQQAQYARQRIASATGRQREIRLTDYRDIDDGPYNAVSVIEMGEHVGAAEYPAFAARLAKLLGPGARLLIQQMSRGLGPPMASRSSPPTSPPTCTCGHYRRRWPSCRTPAWR